MVKLQENSSKKVRVPGVIAEDRPQPHNHDAERAVLAAMLREPSPCVDMAIELLGNNADVFYSHAHREIFKAIEGIFNDTELKVDLISLAHQLTKRDSLEDIGGEIYLAELYNTIATTANLESWCGIVREFAVLRSMINVCTESLFKCYDENADAATLVDQIETDIFNVRNISEATEIVRLQESLDTAFQHIQDLINGKIPIGIPTGLPDLNKIIGGFKSGEMFVLAARPSIGKTSLALNFIRNIAMKPLENGKYRPIILFSLEMTAEQITRRLICTEADIPESRFFDGSFQHHEMPRLTSAVSELKGAEIYIDPTGGLTIAELRAKARRFKMLHNIEMIVIDYLQLMKADGRIDNRQQEVAEISSGIKKLAKELNIPVLVMAQLNREVEKTAGAAARPKLSHLRESGAIEQDADVVAFLHRDRDASKSMDNKVDYEGVDAELIIEKNRNGQTGIVPLKFFPHRMEFVNTRYSDDDRPGS